MQSQAYSQEKEFIGIPGNLSTLEAAIRDESDLLEELRNRKGAMDFGGLVTKKRVQNTFADVKTTVDEIVLENLDVSRVGDVSCEINMDAHYLRIWAGVATVATVASIRYYGWMEQRFPHPEYEGTNILDFFWRNKKEIGLPLLFALAFIGTHGINLAGTRYRRDLSQPTIEMVEFRMANAIPTMAREYARHVDIESDLDLPANSFREAFAALVEYRTAHLYSRTESNDAYIYKVTDRNLAALQTAHRWIASDLEQDKSTLQRVQPRSRKQAEKYMARLGHPDPTDIGRALAHIYHRLITRPTIEGNNGALR